MSKQIRCLTINTDASHHPEKRVGGYAFYIVCDVFKIQKAGMFKGISVDSMEAEIKCIANAVSTLIAQKELPKIQMIVINSDCLFSFKYMTKKSKHPTGKKVYKLLHELKARTGMPKHEFRHVKAHNGTPDARSWVNDWCDKEAKKYMRLALEKFNSI